MIAGKAKFTATNLLLFFFPLGIALLAAEFTLHCIRAFGATQQGCGPNPSRAHRVQRTGQPGKSSDVCWQSTRLNWRMT